MYNILHIARLLDAFAEEAIANSSAYRVGTSPANGGAGATTTRATSREWRCAAFDRAAIRMSCNGYLLPRDGYGDRYMSEFWAEHQDLRYKQDISECGWPAFVSRSHDGFAPLTKEEQLSFDATSYAACLEWVARRPNDASSALPEDLSNADDPHGIFRELHNLSSDPFRSNSSHRDGNLVGSRAGYPIWNPSNAGAVGHAITERLYASSPGIPREESSVAAGGVEKAGGSTSAGAPIGNPAKASAPVPDGAPVQRPPEKLAAPLRIKFPPEVLVTKAASQQKSKDLSPRADIQREPEAPRSQLAPSTGANGNSNHAGPSRSQSNDNHPRAYNNGTVTANGHVSSSQNRRLESQTQPAPMPTNGHTAATNGGQVEPRAPSSQPTRRSESSTSQSSSSSTTHYPPRLKPREALQPRLPTTTEEAPAPRLASVQMQDPMTDTERNGQVDPPPSSPLQSPIIGPARWSSTSRHTPIAAPAPDAEVTRLRDEIGRLQVALAAQNENRTLLIASLERERATVDAERQAALAREAKCAEREARAADAAAARDARHADELAQLRNELAQLRHEGAKREEDARDREGWWRAEKAKWDAECAEFKIELGRREEQLARRDREQDEQMQVQAGLRQQLMMIQASMNASMRAGQAGSSAMVLSLRKRPHMHLGEDSENEGSSKDIQDPPSTRSRRVKRRSASPDTLPAQAFAYDERKFKPKPPWYHVEELTFHTAETRPNHTAASIVEFIKANAVSIEYHKTKGRTATFHKKYLTLRLPDGRSAIVSADYYRLPTLFLSHFLWAYVWGVITRGEAFGKEMFNLLHLARLLRALVEGAIRAASQYNLADGQDICTWRFLAFDRALIRMSYDEFLLPIDGYGDRYNEKYWKRHQDTKYRPRQEIEHRNWQKIVTSRNEWVAPLVGEELRTFDAAAFAECLHIRDGVPIWEPISEAGRTATERLHAKYTDVRSDIAESMGQATTLATAIAHSEPAPSSCVATERFDDAATIAPEQRHPRLFDATNSTLHASARSFEGVATIVSVRSSSCSFGGAETSRRASRHGSSCSCECIACYFRVYIFAIFRTDATSKLFVSPPRSGIHRAWQATVDSAREGGRHTSSHCHRSRRVSCIR
ncbi:hypothetical protein K523DRAFT_247586 [Schizophyllum commune Tattone D]|nr:hypothetical protein K523DRAFT_247586 [Schizophyllum commune Tattone D]